jgi:penicillin amidase
VVQGGLFRFHGRATSYAPSYRYVTDLGSDHIWSALAGGPSGRRFSRGYASDVENWLTGSYKCLSAWPAVDTAPPPGVGPAQAADR